MPAAIRLSALVVSAFVAPSLPGVATPACAAAQVQAFDRAMVHAQPGGAPYLSIRDSSGITDAMEHGDVHRLRALRDDAASQATNPAVRTFLMGLADAGLARIAGDFAGSNAILDRVQASLGPLGDPRASINPFLTMIALTRSGNLYLQGDIPGWAAQQARIKQTIVVPLRAYYGIPGLEIRNAALIAPAVPAADIPAPSVTGPARDQVPFRKTGHAMDHRILIEARVPATIDGEAVDAVVDTGTLTSVLPAGFARRHKLREIARGDDDRTFVLVPELVLGQTVFRNQIFALAPVPVILIGAQALGRLAHLTFNQEGMAFGADMPFACTTPLRVSSLRGGADMHILMPLQITDATFDNAIFDSGDDTPEAVVIRTRSLPRDRFVRHTTERVGSLDGIASVPIALEPAQLRIGAVVLDDMIKYSESRSDMAPTITAGVLRHGTMRIDFSRHVACFDERDPD